MDISELFAPWSPAAFVEQHYQKLPHSGQGVAEALRPLGSWQSLGEILSAESPDVMVVRQSRRHEGLPPRDRAAAEALVAEGYTLLVRHAERQHAGLAELAAAFGRLFADPVNIHLYVTPPGTHGFGWHYDAEEVFIVQTTGRKQYSLRKNTVNPWPIEETLPADMQFEREMMPLVRCTLAGGDLLYIPGGYWHYGEVAAEEAAEPAISLAIGITSRTCIDLYDALRRRLLDNLLWRTRLPVRGEAAFQDEAQRLAQLREISELLRQDLDRLLRDEAWLRGFLEGEAER